MGFEIRVLTDLDLNLLDDLGTAHAAYFRSRFHRPGRGEVLVAVDGGGAVGGVFLSWDAADEPEVRQHLDGVPIVFHLHVDPGHRHQGIGRALLRCAEDRLRERGFDRVLLGVDTSNGVARALYEWLGYRPPAEPGLSGLGQEEPYDILVADLDREPPQWE